MPPPQTIDHICNLSFTKQIVEHRARIIDDLSDHQLVRSSFRRFLHAEAPEITEGDDENLLVQYIPFIGEILTPHIIDFMIQCSQDEERKQEELSDHVMMCWWQCAKCCSLEGFMKETLLSKLQTEAKLWEAEQNGKDMTLILPRSDGFGGQAILSWLEKV